MAGIRDLTYDGTAQEQEFRVYDGSTLLVENEDYTVSYKNNREACTFEDAEKLTDAEKKKAPQLSLRMKGNYKGTRTVYYNIRPLSVNDGTSFSVSVKKSGKHTKVTLRHNGKALKENRDFRLDGISDTAVTITGIGNYRDTRSFPIAEAADLIQMSRVSVSSIPAQFYIGRRYTAADLKDKTGAKDFSAEVYDPKGTKLREGVDYEKELSYWQDGVQLDQTSFPRAGSDAKHPTTVTVRVTGKGAYSGDSIETTYRILKASEAATDIGKGTFKLKVQEYTGKAVTITAMSQFDKAPTLGKTPVQELTLGKDFVVLPGSYVQNTARGTAKVTFVGIGEYTGT